MNQLVSIGSRLKEERQRLAMSQTQLGEAGGITKKTQMLYESGERYPDAWYLWSISSTGADVGYIITGARGGPVPEVLTADERYLLEQYRNSPQALKNAALRVLLGGEVQRPPKIKIDGKVTGQVVEGGLVNNGPVSFGSKGRVKKK